MNSNLRGSINTLFLLLYLLCRCIIDSKAAKFSAESCTMLTNFGEMVVRELEKEKILAAQKHEAKALLQVKDNILRAVNMIRYGS